MDDMSTADINNLIVALLNLRDLKGNAKEDRLVEVLRRLIDKELRLYEYSQNEALKAWEKKLK